MQLWQLPRITRPPEEVSKRRKVIYLLAAGVTLLFAMIVSQTSFDLNFLNPDSNQQIAVFAGLSALVFLLFVALTFVLARNLIKLFAERRLGVLGSKFRTRDRRGWTLALVSASHLHVLVRVWADEPLDRQMVFAPSRRSARRYQCDGSVAFGLCRPKCTG